MPYNHFQGNGINFLNNFHKKVYTAEWILLILTIIPHTEVSYLLKDIDFLKADLSTASGLGLQSFLWL